MQLHQDVESLEAPFIIGNVDSAETAIGKLRFVIVDLFSFVINSVLFHVDHNQYVHNDYVWQSNYCAGLRVLDEAGMNPEAMIERAYFDVAPECDTPVFSGG